MSKVNLLIVGEQKCGSTSLARALGKHSSINFIKRELRAFGKNKNPEEVYSRHIKEDKAYNGEKSPMYMYNDNSIPEALEYNKDMKIIVILRNPIDRAKSAHNMFANKNVEKRTFETAIEEQLNKLESSTQSTTSNNARFHYVRRGLYSVYLKRLYERVDKKNVLVLISEKVWENPQQELDKVFKFLDLPSEEISIMNKNNSYKKSIAPETEEKLKKLYKPTNDELSSMLNESLPW